MEANWNNAPEDAECIIDNAYFAKWVNGVEFEMWPERGEWEEVEPIYQYSLQDYLDESYAWIVSLRPTRLVSCKVCGQSPCGHYNECPNGRPAKPEWDGTGYPPIGCECEISLKERDAWAWCKVLGVHEESDSIWILESDGEPITFELSAYKFRPIQSVEQRQFDEIMDAIKPPGGWPFLTLSDIEETVEAILSKYELKERK